MATEKLTPELVEALGMCWTAADAQKILDVTPGNPTELSVSQVVAHKAVAYEDAMSAVCRTDVTPEGLLRAFAIEKAEEQVVNAVKDFGTHGIFQEAIAAAKSGDAEKIQQASRAIHRVTRALIHNSPDNRIGHLALKAIRACVHADAGEAALGAAAHSAERAGWVGDKAGLKKEQDAQRKRLAKIV